MIEMLLIIENDYAANDSVASVVYLFLPVKKLQISQKFANC